jgi:hypothetical protein
MIRLTLLGATFLAGIASAVDFPLPCRFIPNDSAGVNRATDCAVQKEGRIQISQAALSKMSFSADGLARAFIKHRWYYIKKDGTTLPVITYDNGADYFSEGLVRSRVASKIAYFDTQFKQVIPAKYDWGWPFEDGKALVCTGCVESAPDSDGHMTMKGGRWGYIDRNGRQIVTVTHLREELIK